MTKTYSVTGTTDSPSPILATKAEADAFQATRAGGTVTESDQPATHRFRDGQLDQLAPTGERARDPNAPSQERRGTTLAEDRAREEKERARRDSDAKRPPPPGR